MYILNIAKAMKKMLMKSKTLSLQTIIKELDFLKKTVIIQWSAWKKKKKKKKFIVDQKQNKKKKKKKKKRFIVDHKQINRKNTWSLWC